MYIYTDIYIYILFKVAKILLPVSTTLCFLSHTSSAFIITYFYSRTIIGDLIYICFTKVRAPSGQWSVSPITCREHEQGPTGEDDRLFKFQKLGTEVDSLCILEADERSINDSSILFPGSLL